MKILSLFFILVIGLNIFLYKSSSELLSQISSTYEKTQEIRFLLNSNARIQRSLALFSISLSTNQHELIEEAKKIFKETSLGFQNLKSKRSDIALIVQSLNGIDSEIIKIKSTSTQNELFSLIDKIEDVSYKISIIENEKWKAELESSEKILQNYEDLNLLINGLAIILTVILSAMTIFFYRKFQLENEIAKESQMKSSLFTTLTEAIFVTDSKGLIISCNQSCHKLTGLDSRVLVGKKIESLIPVPTIEHDQYVNTGRKFNLYSAIREGRTISGLKINTFLKGKETWLMANLQPVLDLQNGKNFSMILSITDITEDIYAQKQIKEQQQRILDSSKSDLIAQMAGGIAHEINNPLTIINSSMELLELKASDKEFLETATIQKSTSKVRNTVERISKIVNGMLILSRKKENVFAKTKIGLIIQTAMDFSQIILDKNQVQLIVLDNSFDEEIECNHIQISQVIINLIKNAVDAIKENDEKWIKIDVETNLEGVIINLTDSGKGMSDELKEKIMQPFFTSKNAGEGTGLGLSISRTIIENHYGSISVSKKSVNTQFNIFLPFKMPLIKDVG